ncbi:MAG: hypothetical protein H7175_11590 [Burkholderiales bacterium]|nr:hypothetical protein [Anaerolineae bacterium]
MEKLKNEDVSPFTNDISLTFRGERSIPDGCVLRIALSTTALFITAAVIVAALAVIVVRLESRTTSPISLPEPLAFSSQTFTVDSTSGWQNTDVVLQMGDQVVVEYVSGEWHIEPSEPYSDADGGASGCDFDDCLEPVRAYTKSGLVGRIGDGEAFAIGNYAEITAQTEGPLQLRVNDAGILDNEGSITVSITR